MSLFQEAAKLNNAGVDALFEGDQNCAIDCMTKAIKLMKTELSKMRSPELDIDSSIAAGPQSTDTTEIPSMDSCDTIVFNQAIRIPADANLSDFNMNIYTSAVIYNLALSHHFKASGGDAICMMKAEKLYCMVLKLLDDNTLNVHTALVVKLACINNLSQIRYSNGDYANAKEGLSDVSYFMQNSSNQDIFEEPAIQGLLMNILLLKAPSVASAA